MNAIVSNVVPSANPDTSVPEIHCDVFYYGGTLAFPVMSALVVPFAATDTVNQLGAKLSAAVDTEGQRIAGSAPQTVLAPSFSRLR